MAGIPSSRFPQLPIIKARGGALGMDIVETGVGMILDAALGSTSGTLVYRDSNIWNTITIDGGLSVEAGVLKPTIKSAVVPLVGVVATTGGAIASWQPSEGGIIVVLRAVVVVTTGSTGAANLSVGVAANGTTSATNLITATSCHTAAVIIDSITNQTTAVAPVALYMSATQFVTFTGSADSSGLVGSALIEYWKP